MSSLRLRFEPMITWVFRSWWRWRRGVTLGVRGIACDEAGRVLLVRHTYVDGWHLPGGGVERGETAAEAVLREMAEEGGVEGVGAPTLLGFYSNHANFPNDHIALYRIQAWRPCATRSEGEIAERGFFAIDALPETVSKGTRRRLSEVFEGAAASDHW
jgi:ADP-ribose pyrophosphatase YjhB (NUDIX family)